MTIEVKGRARINVSDDLIKLASVKIEKPKAGEIIWDSMKAEGLFDTFQSFLLLPDEYAIIGVFFDLSFYQWVVVVESDTLPIPPQDKMLPTLMPTYQRMEDGNVKIIDLQVFS
jgi:hypothetical protein